MRIVTISGRKGAGKSTLARSIAEWVETHWQRTCRIQPLAGPLKVMAHQMGVDLTLKDAPNLICPYGGLSTRQFLQSFGQAMRGIDPDFWLKLWQKKIHPVPPWCVIVDDVRFRNEFAFFKRLGAFQIRLHRDPNLLTPDPDSSEHDLDGFTDWNLEIHAEAGMADANLTSFKALRGHWGDC